MTIDEKNAWAFLLIAVAGATGSIVALLAVSAGAAVPPAELDFAPIILGSIGAAILAGIVAGIAIRSATPASDRRRDQRDREIARLGEHVGQAFLVLGGVVGLVLALTRSDPFAIAMALYFGFVLSAVAGSIARLVAYRRGVPAW